MPDLAQLRRDAEEGNPKAQVALAEALLQQANDLPEEEGESEAADQLYREAVGWVEKAASQGHAEAQFWLGEDEYEKVHTFYPIGSHDPKQALSWYQAAADQGHAKACMMLCELHWDILFDQEGAAKWYRRGRQLGHPHDNYILGFKSLGFPMEAGVDLEHLIQSAERGKLREQRALGLYYASVSPPDFIKAYAWLAQGLRHALSNSIPPYKYGEDRTIRALRFLHLVLDNDELEQVQKLISEIEAQHPPEPRLVPGKNERRFFYFFSRNKNFDAALNTLMAIVTFHRLSSDERDKLETRIKRDMSKILGIRSVPQTRERLKAGVSNPEIIDTMHIQETPIPALSDLQEDVRHGVYVVTMRNLGIKPAIPGERWRRGKNLLGMFMYLVLDEKRDAEIYLLEKHGIDMQMVYELDTSVHSKNRQSARDDDRSS
jgi:TPR repeat protein